MPDVNTNIVWTLKDNVSAGAVKLKKELAGVGVQAKGTSGVMSKLSAATGGLVTPTSLAMAGAFALVGGFVAVTKAAIDEQKNIAKLDAALKANVAGFDGNTKAIEKTISARENLAFSDDELRDSLAVLVAATHDVDKAFTIQSTAMDLARLKGISLGDATEALIRVEAGSYRILKSLGIVLKDGATQQDALNAVQKVATGQAKAYADTIEGKAEKAQIKFNDVIEDLGQRGLPLVVTGLNAVTIALDLVTGNVPDTTERLLDLQQTLIDVARTTTGPFRNEFVSGWIDAQQKQHDAAVGITTSAVSMKESIHRATDGISSDVDRAGDHVRTMGRNTQAAARKAKAAIHDLRDSAVSDAGDLIDKVYDPIIARDELLTNNAEINAAKRVLASSKATAAEKRDARATLHSVAKDNDEIRLNLLSAGKLTAKEQKAWVADLKARMKESTGTSRRYLQQLIDKILELGGLSTSIDIKTRVTRDEQRHRQQPGRQHGGPVHPGEAYTVGEHGPETLVMGNQGGTVLSNGVGNIPVIHTHVYLNGREIATAVSDEQEKMYRRAGLAQLPA